MNDDTTQAADTKIGSNMVKRLTYPCLGLLYGICLAILGWQAAGAGHGTFFFFSVAVFPYGIGLVLWVVVAVLLPNVHNSLYRMLFLIVIALRYFLVTVYALRWGPEELPHMSVAWEYSPAYILMPLTLFIGGQILIWLMFFRYVTYGPSLHNSSFNNET